MRKIFQRKNHNNLSRSSRVKKNTKYDELFRNQLNNL